MTINCPFCGTPGEFAHMEEGEPIWICYECETSFNIQGEDLGPHAALTAEDWAEVDRFVGPDPLDYPPSNLFGPPPDFLN